MRAIQIEREPEPSTGDLLPADPDLFREASSRFASSVAVVTTAGTDGDGCGLTMTAVVPVSISPMQYLACLGHKSATLAAIRKHRVFCINVLSASQAEISNRFAGKGQGKFETVEHFVTKGGVPVIAGAVANILCDVAEIVPSGDHDIVIGTVTHAAHTPGDPLVYFAKSYARLGDDLAGD
ncbi:flavin reductase family protein [Microbaculum sp. FT89]|uniref:flavin reductase family protein n=1 Tax=Microbaculum sp. FT89 TaxID=3447298 RepID=UPI003F52EF8D